ncbi:hypothetical protein BEWA_016300 [Theileria equi strain WA]|uniref:Uncharacterized protein n=1 Tax=Theileria equi strain WA TaxID=1537102 RepID=L1LCR0_THEEQ|nr:hypothetical protein BEWA_016300 [Theileria equi strain WA]EKX73069.1 hypothetical protein BEWA_016300 [Theileria equi strain WA]|eukprot:XP_004832521.1 hypothetical protein BEWA_016300 [Theileria equi strain WA]
MDGKWISSGGKYATIKNLRIHVPSKYNFADISSTTNATECTIFQVELVGITTKHFFPKPGHVSIKVKDGGKELWTPINASDVCLFCLVYKKGDKELLEVAVIEASLRKWKFFERVDGGWKNLTGDDLFKKLTDMSKSE